MSGFIVIVVLLWVSGVLVASGSLIGLAYHPEERARPPEPEIKGRYKSLRKLNQVCWEDNKAGAATFPHLYIQITCDRAEWT